jgi:hypothetical protein
MTTTINDQHYQILQKSIFSLPSLEGVLWQWQDNPFAGLGASAMEQVPILNIPSCGKLELTAQSTTSVLSTAQGAAMMGVSTDAGKAVVEFAASLKNNADHQKSVQVAIQEWIALAEKALSDLNIEVKTNLSFCEFMDLANESGEFDFDPKSVCKKAVKEYGWSVIEAECGDWGDYFDFEDKKIVVF